MTQNTLLKEIELYVNERYKKVFSKKLLNSYVNDYFGFTWPNYLIQKLAPLVPKNSKILDVGSGFGSFVIAARKYGFDCYGLEINNFEYEISKQRLEEEEYISDKIFKNGSALEMPFPDKSFDVVTFWNVLEHVPDYKKALSEAKRVLKKNGRIFIIAPNYCSFRSEAHYHVPWFPFFPRYLARVYLKFLGKDPWFFDQCIFYITMYGLLRCIRRLGLSVTIDVSEKINNRHVFKTKWFQTVIDISHSLHLIKVLIFMINAQRKSPFAKNIDIIAIK